MVIKCGTTDITEYITSITWSGSRSQVCRKLVIEVVNAPNDPNIKAVTLKLADKIYLLSNDEKTEYFRGFIIERERSSKTGALQFTACDICYYLVKSTATYNFKSKTAEAITKMVCEDLKVPVGSLAKTGHKQKLIVKNCKVYDIVMKAYTQAKKVTKKPYMVKASKGKLNVVEVGAKVATYQITEDSTLINSSYKESIDNMVNRVKIYDGNGKAAGVVKNDSNIKKYGVFQQVYTKEKGKDAKTQAKAMLTGVEKTAVIEAVGDVTAVTGNGIQIVDSASGLTGLFYIVADTHKWVKGVHTMTLQLEFQKSMDLKS